MGFHIDGCARDLVNMPARLVIPVPSGVALRDAACAPIAFATVQHMLFDNARLEPGESVLVHAGGFCIRSGAIPKAKAVPGTVTPSGSDAVQVQKGKAVGGAKRNNTHTYQS